MKRLFRCSMVAALLIVMCLTGASCAKEKTTLKIVSFNIQYHNNNESPLFLRAEMLRDFIAETQPDSIGMQEATSVWREQLDAVCFGENYSSVGNAKSSTGEMNPIYYRNDKFTLVDSGAFWLSDTPDVEGSKFESSSEVRTCTWARLKDIKTKEEFIHLNLHLDYKSVDTSTGSSTLRTEQVKTVLHFTKNLGDTPLILTGDFNQRHHDAQGNPALLYQYLTGEDSFTGIDGNSVSGHFSDARLEAPDTVSPTEWASMKKYHQEGGNPATLPIDYIFYTADDFEPMVYRNILSQDGLFTISDHLAQYCEFTVK